MLLHRAYLRQANERIEVLLWEFLRDLDLQPDGFYQTGDLVMINAFDDADTLGGQVARLAESQNVNAGIGPIEARNISKGLGALAIGG
jgi:hypothetical protein